MKKLFLLVSLFWVDTGFAQTVIIGDSTNRYVERLNQTFSNNFVSFDFDCDSFSDLKFNSSTSSGQGNWPRLSFYMQANVQVLNSGTGLVTPFTQNQVLQLNSPNIWTSNLDFIWGYGQAGVYGQNINKKYIVFRKLGSSDTAYFFMEVSNSNAVLTIHKVISNCPNSRILEVKNEIAEKSVKIYPNPFNDELFIVNPGEKPAYLYFYNLQGQLIREYKNRPAGEINVSDLPMGLYLLKFSNDTEKTTRLFIKQ